MAVLNSEVGSRDVGDVLVDTGVGVLMRTEEGRTLVVFGSEL